MTKEQIFRSDRFFTKIENGEISTIEIYEEQAFDQNIRKYYNSANYRDSVDARILILEQEHRIQELELALTEIATRTRLSQRRGGAVQQVISAEQMVEIAEKALNPPQQLPPKLPHTNQYQIRPQNPEPRLLD